MPDPRIDDAPGRGGWVTAFDYGLALVVASSPVNRIVVSRIIQEAGLKVRAETPDAALSALEALMPATVVLDGGADNRECEHVMAKLQALQGNTDASIPFVVLLATPHAAPVNDRTIDAIVAKPILPERLQPLIHRLLDRLRA
jgi:CheY-like chemotaxis protein